MTSLIHGLERITTIMKTCITNENVENGLLEDVNTIIPVYHNEMGVDEPCVWIVQHPTTAQGKVNIQQTLTLVSPFEFVCVEYDPDPEVAECKGQNLATRVALSVLKNYQTVQSQLGDARTIRHIDFNTYYPVGEVSIAGKSDKVPATGIVLDVVHDVNWVNCCKAFEAAINSETTETQDNNIDD